MDVAERFMHLFRGLGRAHGSYVIRSVDRRKKKVTGRATTKKEPVTVEKWQAHLDGRTGIGIVPIDDDAVCRWAAIDVDVYDLDLNTLERNVREQGFPLTVCRTKSGGAHLYAFFSETVSAGTVRERMMEFSVALGHPKTEIFPKQSELGDKDDVGSWINMPYFGGDDTTRYAIRDGDALNVNGFLDHAESSKVSLDQFVSVEVKRDERLRGGPPCLEMLSTRGFPRGTRNKALFNLGVFVRMAYGDEWKEKIDAFNRAFLNPPLSTEEVRVIVGSLAKKKYFYTCNDEPIVSACNKAICVKREHGIGGSAVDPGVVLECLIKVTTDPPTWYVNVDGRRLKLADTEDLLHQTKFIVRCFEHLNVLPIRIRNQDWDELIRNLLEKLEEIQAPDDAGMTGQFVSLLERFCFEQPPARDKEQVLLGKPLLDRGTVYFRSSDLMSYLDKHKFRVDSKTAWMILRDMKATTKQFSVKNKKIRCWAVPLKNRQTESFNVPDVDMAEDF
jgi:hypothetical protein